MSIHFVQLTSKA